MATPAENLAATFKVGKLSELSDRLGDLVRDQGQIYNMVMDDNWKVSITQLRRLFSEFMEIARKGAVLKDEELSPEKLKELKKRIVMVQPLLAYAEARDKKGENKALRTALLPLAQETRYESPADFRVLESLMTAFVAYQKLKESKKSGGN